MLSIRGICVGLALLNGAWAAKPCERVATVNHQEIPLETVSSGKGEGLRPYLEKDENALRHLDRYQERNRIRPFNTLLGIAGPGFLVAGLVLEPRSEEKKTFLTWGVVLVATNFLVTRAIQGTSESYLEKAVEEYNKRNSPRIELNFLPDPFPPKKSMVLMVKKDWSF